MAPGAGRQPARRAGPGLLSRLILLPFKLLQGTFQLAGTMLNYTLALVNVIGDRTLPGSWMRGIRGAWQGCLAAQCSTQWQYVTPSQMPSGTLYPQCSAEPIIASHTATSSLAGLPGSMASGS